VAIKLTSDKINLDRQIKDENLHGFTFEKKNNL
jgi:hypothetical protein